MMTHLGGSPVSHHETLPKLKSGVFCKVLQGQSILKWSNDDSIHEVGYKKDSSPESLLDAVRVHDFSWDLPCKPGQMWAVF